jgi:hypothetical protein
VKLRQAENGIVRDLCASQGLTQRLLRVSEGLKESKASRKDARAQRTAKNNLFIYPATLGVFAPLGDPFAR